MLRNENILISLDERHATNIFDGNKTVEFRRRPMSIEIGSVIWIYVKKPSGFIAGKAVVSDFYHLAPSTLWRKFSSVSGLTKKEFFGYFEGIKKGFAISLADVSMLSDPVSLESLREACSNFQPPQFFMRLDEGSPVSFAIQSRQQLSDTDRLESLQHV